MKTAKTALFIFVCISMIFVLGCAPVVKNPAPLSREIRATHEIAPEYRIQVGDTLDLRFYYNPELNETVMVRPDGRISLVLAPEIMAAGLTPQELSAQLNRSYSQEVQRPQVTVILRTFSTQKVHVDGEVNRPGLVNLIGPMTVMQSIAEAGGMKETARTHEIAIIRRNQQQKPYIFTVNLDRIVDGTELAQDVILKPFDIVFVPRSSIAEVNLWVDQYIRKNIPVPFGFGFGWSLD